MTAKELLEKLHELERYLDYIKDKNNLPCSASK